ncbi:hypothetical protein ACFV9W_13445 [Streptomyces sp. NPDC059897]|uniref:hypothetical protein n=1 Tax=Streptomyces sp. NPDC059897 TaxID=3346994 RepID=UPI00365D8318
MGRLRWVAGLLFSVPLFLAVPVVPALPAAPSYAAEPSPHGSLAGSRAGVGRTPPGRELPAPDTSGVVLPPAATDPPPAVSREPRPERPASERPDSARQAVGEPGARPLVNVLPLGAGLLLTGLGLGFLALRLRR